MSLEGVKSVAAAVSAAVRSQALDTSASTTQKRSAPQPRLIRLRRLYFSNRGNSRGFP